MPVSHRPEILSKIRPSDLETCRYVDEHLRSAGFKVYLVGGSVRDLLLGDKGYDIDFTTDATPQQVMKIFPKTVPVGVEFGTVIVLYRGKPVEVTTFRTETEYLDGRRPSKVLFGTSLEEDVARRDFTINGLAYDVKTAQLHDYVGGEADLKAGMVRTIGKPADRFREDGLRSIRGCRFAARLRFTLDTTTALAIRETLETTAKVAPERFLDEWRKTLRLQQKDIFWRLLWEYGILSLFLPELGPALEKPENREIFFSRMQSTRIRNLHSYGALVFLSGLLRAEQLYPLLQRARFPQKTARLCRELLTSPLLSDTLLGELDTIILKTALSKLQPEMYFDHFRLVQNFHSTSAPDLQAKSKDLVQNCLKILRERPPLRIAQLAISGKDILSLGITGANVGLALQWALEQVLRDPSLNNSRLVQKIRTKFGA